MNKADEAMERLEKTIGHTKWGKALFTGTMSPTDVETLIAAVKAGQAENRKLKAFAREYANTELCSWNDYKRTPYFKVLPESENAGISLAEKYGLITPVPGRGYSMYKFTALLSEPDEVCVSRNGNNDTQDSLCLAGDTQPEESEDK